MKEETKRPTKPTALCFLLAWSCRFANDTALSFSYTSHIRWCHACSFEQIERYSQSYCKFVKGRFPGIGDRRCAVVLKQIEQLHQAMHSRKQKNIDLLFDSEKLARFMDAGRATMCKSGKDRSSMAVTLEGAFLLHDRHELPEDKISNVLSQMRAKGTRKKNVFKNISDYRYAFNRLQVMTLPKLLRPPEGTYGATLA